MNNIKAMVYDLESVTNIPKGLEEEYARYKENTKTGFVSHPAYNKIICISWRVLELTDDNQWKDFLIDGKPDAGFISSDDERLVTVKFLDKMAYTKPGYIVGYNNKSFDNPLIIWKGYQYKLSIYRSFLDTYKFNLSPVYDVKLALSNYDQFPLSMRAACISLGLGDPKEGGDGGDVAELYAKGEFDKIGIYCSKDVDFTVKLFKYSYQYKQR